MLPRAVAEDLAPLISALERAGYAADECLYSPEHFGNYVVEFSGPDQGFSIVRERSQYYVAGPPKQILEAAGLWQAFDHRADFAEQLLRWLDSA